jgi:hypothetical protein
MDVHAKTVEDVPGTLALLQQIYDTAKVRAGGKPWFVLCERQPLDSEQVSKGLIFNTQLQYVCSTFFTMKGKEVRLIDPSQRYAFLGLNEFRKMKRHDRKKAVARKVAELFQTNFSSRAEHALDTEWSGKDFDMADALMDVLYYYYRSWGALLDGNVVDNTTPGETVRTPGPSASPKKRRTASNGNSSPPTTTAKVKAALQSLLTDLEIDHYDQVTGKKNAADKLLAVLAAHPAAVAPFLTLLDKLNHKGTGVNAGLSDRLTPLT